MPQECWIFRCWLVRSDEQMSNWVDCYVVPCLSVFRFSPLATCSSFVVLPLSTTFFQIKMWNSSRLALSVWQDGRFLSVEWEQKKVKICCFGIFWIWLFHQNHPLLETFQKQNTHIFLMYFLGLSKINIPRSKPQFFPNPLGKASGFPRFKPRGL